MHILAKTSKMKVDVTAVFMAVGVGQCGLLVDGVGCVVYELVGDEIENGGCYLFKEGIWN